MCDARHKSDQWTVQLHVDSTPVEFKIDTGADVTVISEKTFHTLTPERRLKPPDIPLDSPGGELLCLASTKEGITYSQLTLFVDT